MLYFPQKVNLSVKSTQIPKQNSPQSPKALKALGIEFILLSCIKNEPHQFNVIELNSAHFASFVAAFSTPVAVSSVPMAQEMKSDVVLAGQLVVWTTLISSATVFLSAFALKALGVFM